MRFQESYLSSEQLVRRNAANVMRPNLAEGAKGAQVRAWQDKLKTQLAWAWKNAASQYGEGEYGRGASTAYFGLTTKAATEDFQRAKGLTVDGIVGCNTWKAAGVPASQISGCQARAAHHHAETAIDTTDEKKDKKDPFYKERWFIPLTVGVVIFGIGAVLIAKS